MLARVNPAQLPVSIYSQPRAITSLATTPRSGAQTYPQYARVRYSEIYPGIDLVYYGNQRQLEYDFVVSPGADPRKIELAFDGADSMRVEANGDLVLRTGTQETRQHRPVVYQKVDGTRRVIDGRYRLVGSKRIRFDVAEYRRDLPLVIDPVLSYSTYLGGSGEDVATSVAVDASGNAYVTGSTTSVNFPATTGVVQASNAGQQDVFVTKLSSTGSLVYSTYFGGQSLDNGITIKVDQAGSAHVFGRTFCGIPTTPNAYSTSYSGTFAAKFNASGSQLIYSTFIPGASNPSNSSLAALGPDGSFYCCPPDR